MAPLAFSPLTLKQAGLPHQRYVTNDTTNQVVDLRLIPNLPVLKSTDARNLPERPKPPLPRVKPRNLISVIGRVAEGCAEHFRVGSEFHALIHAIVTCIVMTSK